MIFNESIIREDLRKCLNESSSKKISWIDMLHKMEELGYDYTGDYNYIPDGRKRKEALYRFDYNHKQGTKKLTVQEIKDEFDGNVTVLRGGNRYAPEQSFILMTNKVFEKKIDENYVLKESSKELPEETKEFMNDIKKVFNDRFPKSRCVIGFSDNIGACITMWFYLAQNENEVSNGIMMNDACRTIFQCYDVDNNGVLKDKISFERIAGRGVTRKIHEDDPNEKYLAYSYIKVPYRKISGTKEAVIRNFERYADKLAQIILDNADDINGGIVGGLFDVRDKVAK